MAQRMGQHVWDRLDERAGLQALEGAPSRDTRRATVEDSERPGTTTRPDTAPRR